MERLGWNNIQHVLQSLFDAWDEQHDNENEYDGYEDDEAFNESWR